MKFLFPFLCILVLALGGCEQKKTEEAMTDEELKVYADELAQRFIIVDGHVDLPSRLIEQKINVDANNANILVSTTEGEFDFERSKKGGLDAPFMSIYIPAAYQQQADMGKGLADSLINSVNAIVTQLPDKFALANSPQEVEENFKAGIISLPMGMENAAPFGNDLVNVKYYYDRGVRYATLTHGKDNQICDSSTDSSHTWNGLSPFGREVVAEMNRVGMMIDISHVADSTFYQVMKLSKAPCIASHSSCRHFAPSVNRDMSDDMIRVFGENDGVMMINFYTAFLKEEIWKQKAAIDSLLKGKGMKDSDEAAVSLIEQYRKDHPAIADVGTVADHIDHAVELAGVDHVGLGSDFDGVGGPGNLPDGLKSPAQYPDLIFELLKRGYSEEDIEKICSKNVFRVWNKVAEVAKQLQSNG